MQLSLMKCLILLLQSHAAYPLYLLYSAIKVRCFTGPVDYIHGAAHYSLSESYLLREEIEYKEMVSDVLVKTVSLITAIPVYDWLILEINDFLNTVHILERPGVLNKVM